MLNAVMIGDFCKETEKPVAIGADKYNNRVLLGNTNCPRGALFSSGILAPAGANYRTLLTGDYTAATTKYLDPQELIDGEWSNGYLCPEECSKMKSIQDRASLQVISKCIAASHLAKVCAGDSEPDWLRAMIQFRAISTQCEIERRIICSLKGIYEKAITDPDGMQIVHDFTTTPLDGTTTELTNSGLSAAGACIQAEEPDMFIVAHKVGKKLKAQGYVALCCGSNGPVRDSTITELRGPGGESIFQLSKKLSQLLEISPGIYLTIGATRGSIFYGLGNPGPDTTSYWGFKRTKVQDEDCGPTKINWFERAVIDPCLWKWELPAWDCSEEGKGAIIGHEELSSADSWDYAPGLDPDCGADMSKFSFYVHTCSKGGAAAAPVIERAAAEPAKVE